jgi:hypothetical protein
MEREKNEEENKNENNQKENKNNNNEKEKEITLNRLIEYMEKENRYIKRIMWDFEMSGFILETGENKKNKTK